MPGHLQEGFGCVVTNRFDQLFDDESDPFEVLRAAETRRKESGGGGGSQGGGGARGGPAGAQTNSSGGAGGGGPGQAGAGGGVGSAAKQLRRESQKERKNPLPPFAASAGGAGDRREEGSGQPGAPLRKEGERGCGGLRRGREPSAAVLPGPAPPRGRPSPRGGRVPPRTKEAAAAGRRRSAARGDPGRVEPSAAAAAPCPARAGGGGLAPTWGSAWRGRRAAGGRPGHRRRGGRPSAGAVSDGGPGRPGLREERRPCTPCCSAARGRGRCVPAARPAQNGVGRAWGARVLPLC